MAIALLNVKSYQWQTFVSFFIATWSVNWNLLNKMLLLCWGLTSQSTIFQSCRDRAIASWVFNQYFRGVKCLAQGHNTAAVGLEPRTSRSGVWHSTTEPPRSPETKCDILLIFHIKMIFKGDNSCINKWTHISNNHDIWFFKRKFQNNFHPHCK